MDGKHVEENPGLFQARLAEQCERYDDMVKFIKSYISDLGKTPLGTEERNLFSIAYKNVVGSKRGALRCLHSQLNRVKDEDEKAMVKELFSCVLEELKAACLDCVDVIEAKLEPILKSDEGAEGNSLTEAKVFFLKMKGDYYRYMAEYLSGDERSSITEKSAQCYDEASETAGSLPSTHPVRLGLALNFSVFKYEVLNDPKAACELAKKAFDEARVDAEVLSDTTFNDSKLIMQLLRDNLTLWTNQDLDDSQEDDVGDNVDGTN